MEITGLQMNYLEVCKRKLWLYSNGLTMESNNDRVLEGKILHERSYPQKRKREIDIERSKIDMIDVDYISEIKISSKMEKADRLQMLFYLYQLDQKGVKKKGRIQYPKEKRIEEIELCDENRKYVENSISEINNILARPSPPKIPTLPYCHKCAYYDFCYIAGGED
ncbi:hypothetical protein B4102_2378 [Heyndrickxia sporothermodurans]|uniref:CRISPR-associated exonuclease Cas4 n=1 Tax=Heyndrickxia sporothermodurans TaxID=46224 RepID=A0A150LCJ9_9BACI|nr:CRISPR-associated protein Cas4 [Heyndrickxia sporothermodurans]KYD09965.1 hypothetical protein B4102_2378 [Heyndrickxia sporothermodurans]